MSEEFGGTTEQGGAASIRHRERLKRPRLAWSDAYGAHERPVEAPGVLGSAKDAAIVVADRAVSRIHCELRPEPEGLWVRDLGSTNGVFVDGLRVGSALVPEGGTLRVGGTAVRVRYGDEIAEGEIWSAPSFGELVGESVAMRKLYATVARLAPTDLSVLVLGETGTGKELVARALHDTSPRARFPLGVVDCASMPENLLEAELFGYRRGAFTGADASRAGIVEASEGGTVFLDEIGELPLAMQPKLLRLLESRTFKRIGETRFRRANVRFVAATHRDLPRLVNAGAFREDLYFRLAVSTVVVPPLRERMGDVPLLVDRFAPQMPEALSRAALLEAAAARGWPGNVRELRSFVDRAVALGVVEPGDDDPLLPLPPPSASASASRRAGGAPDALPAADVDAPFKEVRDAWLDHLERSYVGALLERHARNVTAVAEAAGLDRTYIHRLIRKHGL